MKSDDYVDGYEDLNESPAPVPPPLAAKPYVSEPAPAPVQRQSASNTRAAAPSPYEPVSTRRSVEAPASTTPGSVSRAPMRAAVAPEPDTDPSAPISKRMFSLSANVRFTRTPDAVLQKHRGGAENGTPAPAVKPDKPVVTSKTLVPPTSAPAAKIRSDVTPELKSAASSAAFQKTPAPVEASLLRSPSFPASYASPVVTHKPIATVARENRPGLQTEPAQAVPHKSGSLDYLSDYAFWESMEFLGGPATTSVSPVPRPVRKMAPDAITAMFRVVELRQPRHQLDEIAVPEVPVSLPVPVAPKAIVAAAPVPRSEPHAEETVTLVPVVAAEAVIAEPVAVTPQPEPVVENKPSRLQVTVRQEQPFVVPTRLTPVPVQSYGTSYERPPLTLLQEPAERAEVIITQEALEQNAGLLESVLEDFGIRGEIIHVRPGPVVTLYEFEPAPGIKSSRVIGLADDIARSMSALSARVAVVPGRNVIGIELPNATRETVYFREMIASADFGSTKLKLALCLGKTIGGEPVIAELAKMPHLLVAGTTGSGKSVAINTMILSLLYRLTPEECRLIMVDPKMLELSIYDGIPHLLTPVVTDPKKAVMALKWAVREMEDRYRKMSKLGVRNIDGFNARAALAKEKGETVMCTVQTGFDKGTGEPIHEQEAMDLTPMPYIVVIVDEMADLMMVAGKDIEGAIQRLAQMARAAGIHLIMATQRPSVDVITGTIKANFPTRISFQVTSKIDSRTILGEQGAEQLLGQGDMLHMAGGGRISRVHGPFVSDEEVERVVAHLKAQGRPDYLDTVTADESEEEEPETETGGAVFDKGSVAAEDGNELYDQAVKVVMRDKKCSTSYIQRRLQIGYNRAASLVERMEKEGLVGPSNHVGKREILSHSRDNAPFSAADSVD
ncbi:DNA translocase FtsK [Phyllobacterium myrsinacearum]|uniref:S-DNA-T family DNA segregation ATPase FtsK/SpoIIIE n=1 Tax=Phyllobacterium myrsinacearum TaxID=28101 RepID=A0A839EX00_9HYPH|nr:DNA translocase FtsK [Phyllobacterium myrsinacearum]MBA8881020.1 S-DNA-T family DNA segregation ATPase FtsK/SpoIIIE [Phyllobacterium myrsinacearum]